MRTYSTPERPKCPTCMIQGRPCQTHKRPESTGPGHGPLKGEREELERYLAEVAEWHEKVDRW